MLSTAPDGITVTVRLDWDPPLDSGGVAITNYLISVNMSQQISSTDTTITFTLKTIGQHLVEISAVNDCGILGDNVSAIINITGKNHWLQTQMGYFVHFFLYRPPTGAEDG
jgi:hypothetical protein